MKAFSTSLALFAQLLLIANSQAALESYTTTTGVAIDAERATLVAGGVVFERPDGLHLTVPLDKLSAADQARAKAQAGGTVAASAAAPTPTAAMPAPTSPVPGAAAAAPRTIPQLRVAAGVGTRRDQNARGVFYMQSMIISPYVNLEGPSTAPLPALEATMMVIAMDTGEKYRNRVEQYNVLTRETLTVPAVDSGKLRKIEFKTAVTQFDAYRDASNVGGKVYKWFVFSLKDPASGQQLAFQTNCKELEAAARRGPDAMNKVMALGLNDLFPNTFK
jgi:hypothetical protein